MFDNYAYYFQFFSNALLSRKLGFKIRIQRKRNLNSVQFFFCLLGMPKRLSEILDNILQIFASHVGASVAWGSSTIDTATPLDVYIILQHKIKWSIKCSK